MPGALPGISRKYSLAKSLRFPQLSSRLAAYDDGSSHSGGGTRVHLKHRKRGVGDGGWGMRMGMGSTLEHEDEFGGEDKNIMSLV